MTEPMTPEELHQLDAAYLHLKSNYDDLLIKYQKSLAEIERLEAELSRLRTSSKEVENVALQYEFKYCAACELAYRRPIVETHCRRCGWHYSDEVTK
jgi:hypothetical protein